MRGKVHGGKSGRGTGNGGRGGTGNGGSRGGSSARAESKPLAYRPKGTSTAVIVRAKPQVPPPEGMSQGLIDAISALPPDMILQMASIYDEMRKDRCACGNPFKLTGVLKDSIAEYMEKEALYSIVATCLKQQNESIGSAVESVVATAIGTLRKEMEAEAEIIIADVVGRGPKDSLDRLKEQMDTLEEKLTQMEVLQSEVDKLRLLSDDQAKIISCLEANLLKESKKESVSITELSGAVEDLAAEIVSMRL